MSAMIRSRQHSAVKNYAVATIGAALNDATMNVKMFPWLAKGDGVTNDTAAINAAVSWLGLSGGGTLVFPKGEYLVDRNAPAAANYDNDVCIDVQSNHVKLKGAGRGATIIRKASNANNAHIIKIGRRIGTPIAVTGAEVSEMTIIGDLLNATANNQNSIDVSSGARNIKLHALDIQNSAGYAIGFQSDNFQGCTVDDVTIDGTLADGIDFKDTNALNLGNVINNVRVKNFGQGGVVNQAGVNVRGGVAMTNITVTDFAGDRHGVRIDSIAAGGAPSSLKGFYIKPSAMATTVGVYINGGTTLNDADVSGGTVVGAGICVDARWRFAQVSDVRARACGIGFQAMQDNQFDNCSAYNSTVAGFKARGSINTFSNCHGYSNAVGAVVDAGASLNTFTGGVLSGNTVQFTDNGTSTKIVDVVGFSTKRTASANFPIDSTGTKVVGIAHGLPFVPALNDVQLSFRRNTDVGDARIGFFWVYGSDANNIYCNVNVSTASATAGAQMTLVAEATVKR